MTLCPHLSTPFAFVVTGKTGLADTDLWPLPGRRSGGNSTLSVTSVFVVVILSKDLGQWFVVHAPRDGLPGLGVDALRPMFANVSPEPTVDVTVSEFPDTGTRNLRKVMDGTLGVNEGSRVTDGPSYTSASSNEGMNRTTYTISD